MIVSMYGFGFEHFTMSLLGFEGIPIKRLSFSGTAKCLGRSEMAIEEADDDPLGVD